MKDNKIIKALQEMVDYPHYYEEGQELKEVLDLINRQKAEIKKYKEYYKTMEAELDSFRKDQVEVKFLKNRIRTEAIKEFAERLKKKSQKRVSDVYGARVYIQDIDNLAKEMTEEQK